VTLGFRVSILATSRYCLRVVCSSDMFTPAFCGRCLRGHGNSLTYIHRIFRDFSLTTPRYGKNTIATIASSPSDARVIFSGIQPTGVPHLGNYLGALREWVHLQNNAAPGTELIFSIVDLHALTFPQDPPVLRKWRKESFAVLIAAGLDPKLSTIFFQSSVRFSRDCGSYIRITGYSLTCFQVPAHSELMWILSTVASMGYLSRMTQWKV